MPGLIGDRAPIAPSVMTSQLHEALLGHKIDVQVMDHELIEQVIENYASAALRVKKAGFDMVLLHGGHGWLLAQFTSPRTNRRTDEYGGSLENRARFPLRVLTRIRELCGPDLAIEYRFSADELVPGGLSQEEGIRFAQLIEDKVDCFHASCGTMGELKLIPYIHPAYFLPQGKNVHFAAKLKQAVSKPVTAVGAIVGLRTGRAHRGRGPGRHGGDGPGAHRRPVSARQDHARSGRRGHPLHPLQRVSQPGGPVHPGALRDQPADRHRDGAGERVRRSRRAGRRWWWSAAGPAGMEAAIVAAERGHDVVLFEKSDRLGGNLIAASGPAFKDEMKRFLDYLVRRVKALPIDVRLGRRGRCSVGGRGAPRPPGGGGGRGAGPARHPRAADRECGLGG